MTAPDTEPTATDDHRAIAENLLRKAEAGLAKLGNEPGDIATAVSVLQVRATAGAGYAQLAATDAAAELANRGAALAGDVLAQLHPAGGPDLMIDFNNDVWVRLSPGNFRCITASLDDRTAAEVHETYGPCREYGLLPPRPGER